MHEIQKWNELSAHKFTFKMNLVCGAKKCGRRLATASVTFTGEYTSGADTNPDSYLRYEYVSDTNGWLHIMGVERVPVKPYDNPDNSWDQPYKYGLPCTAQPLIQAWRNGKALATRRRDIKAMQRLGCGADHIIKLATLENAMLDRLGLERGTKMGLITLSQCWEIEKRLKATRGVPDFILS